MITLLVVLALLALPTPAAAIGIDWDGLLRNFSLDGSFRIMSESTPTLIVPIAAENELIMIFDLYFANSGSGSTTVVGSLTVPGHPILGGNPRQFTLDGTQFRVDTVVAGFAFGIEAFPLPYPNDPLLGTLDVTVDGGPTHTYPIGLLQPIPEPATLLLMGSGLVGVGAWWRRRRAA